MDKENYSQMLAFLWANEHGSFSSAARARGLSPSAISKLVTRLENRLSVRLFQRGTRSLTLTEEGAIYLRSARSVMDAMAEEVGYDYGRVLAGKMGPTEGHRSM